MAVEAARDIDALWRGVDDAAKAETALRDVLPDLITAYGAGAATLAADWYDDTRDERGVPGRFTAIPAEIADVGAQALVGWALVKADTFVGFQGLILGGSQRRILNHARFTVTGSSASDPRADGWVRVGRGECDWCDQYLDGEVRTVAYDFPAHDNCHCHAEPAW